MKNKITNVINLKKKIDFLKKNKKKIVLCHGVFDILHLGHCRHFEKARQLGDILIVSVTKSQFVFKGTDRPFFSDKIRCEMLSNISTIDFVILSDERTAVDIINEIKPDIYVKGAEYKKSSDDILNQINIERKSVEKYGGKVKFTNDLVFSSSKILNDKFEMFNEQQKKFLEKIKKKLNFKDLKNQIDKFKNLKILVIGETIIDKYIFSNPLGKSGKESFLVYKKKNFEDYLGGAAVVTKCINSFANNVNFLTYLGEKKEYSHMIDKNLKRSDTKIFYKKESPTIVKTRYVDIENNTKVFGVYEINSTVDVSLENKMMKYLNKNIRKFDLVMVYDYDHGLISKKVANFICNKSKYLVLNYQLNSANWGFHNLKKYNKADCLVINENEFRTQLRNKYDKLSLLVKDFFKQNNIKKIVITRGNSGSIYFERKNKKIIECPAFANHVVDKIGAGDSFMSIFSLSLFNKNMVEISLLFGSLAADIAVNSIGNSQKIDKKTILKRLDTYFKI